MTSQNSHKSFNKDKFNATYTVPTKSFATHDRDPKNNACKNSITWQNKFIHTNLCVFHVHEHIDVVTIFSFTDPQRVVYCLQCKPG